METKKMTEFGVETIPDASEISNLGGSGSCTPLSESLSQTGSRVLQNGLTISDKIVTSVPVVINSTIYASVSGNASVRTYLHLRSDNGTSPNGRIAMLGMCYANPPQPDASLEIKTTQLVQPGKTYYLELEVSTTLNGGTASGNAGSSRMEFNVVDTYNMIKYGAGGLIMSTDSSNYFILKEKNGVMSFSFKGNFDAPNVALAGYDVTSLGSIIHRFGAKMRPSGSATYLGNGKYQIPHAIGHVEYNVIPIYTGSDDNSTSIAREISTLRTTTSCVIRITNLNNEGIQVPFTVTIFGKN